MDVAVGVAMGVGVEVGGGVRVGAGVDVGVGISVGSGGRVGTGMAVEAGADTAVGVVEGVDSPLSLQTIRRRGNMRLISTRGMRERKSSEERSIRRKEEVGNYILLALEGNI